MLPREQSYSQRPHVPALRIRQAQPRRARTSHQEARSPRHHDSAPDGLQREDRTKNVDRWAETRLLVIRLHRLIPAPLNLISFRKSYRFHASYDCTPPSAEGLYINRSTRQNIQLLPPSGRSVRFGFGGYIILYNGNNNGVFFSFPFFHFPAIRRFFFLFFYL